MYNFHGRRDDGTCQSWVGSTYNPNLLPVSRMLHPRARANCLRFRYFALFITYTPYTIAKCKRVGGNGGCLTNLSNARRLLRVGRDGVPRRVEMWVELRPSLPPSDKTSDFILAACDVEANFAVVKAYQYTNLLSCMLLNSWVLSFGQSRHF